jgi:hypothetical protein
MRRWSPIDTATRTASSASTAACRGLPPKSTARLINSRLDIANRDATIDVNYQAATNSGTVNTRGDNQRDLFPVLEDLREALRERRLQRRSRLAPWYVGLGTLMMVSQLGLLSLRVLNVG